MKPQLPPLSLLPLPLLPQPLPLLERKSWQAPTSDHVGCAALYDFRYRGTGDHCAAPLSDLEAAEIRAHIEKCRDCASRLARLMEVPPDPEWRPSHSSC